MSPETSRARSRLWMAALAAGAVASALGFVSGPAAAIVGGAEESGPLSRSAIMVLSSRGGVCSGVVVAPGAVLTAAHCATGASDYRIHFRDEAGQPVLLDPAAVVVHPGYDKGAIAGRRRSIDLALIRAPLPARFAPAALATAAPPQGGGATFLGFGVAREREARSTGTLRRAALRVVEPYGRSQILVWAKGAAGSGACEGDSGGPVVSADDTVFAIASWATGSGDRGCGEISQGVLVGPQRAWIDKVLAGWGVSAVWR